MKSNFNGDLIHDNSPVVEKNFVHFTTQLSSSKGTIIEKSANKNTINTDTKNVGAIGTSKEFAIPITSDQNKTNKVQERRLVHSNKVGKLLNDGKQKEKLDQYTENNNKQDKNKEKRNWMKDVYEGFCKASSRAPYPLAPELINYFVVEFLDKVYIIGITNN
jgi:hypothetical protein